MKDKKLIAAILGAVTAYIQMEQQIAANKSQNQAKTAG